MTKSRISFSHAAKMVSSSVSPHQMEVVCLLVCFFHRLLDLDKLQLSVSASDKREAQSHFLPSPPHMFEFAPNKDMRDKASWKIVFQFILARLTQMPQIGTRSCLSLAEQMWFWSKSIKQLWRLQKHSGRLSDLFCIALSVPISVLWNCRTFNTKRLDILKSCRS